MPHTLASTAIDLHNTWLYERHGHAVRVELLAERICERFHGTFAGAVDAFFGLRDAAGQARDEDDAGLVLADDWQEGLDQRQIAEEVHIEQPAGVPEVVVLDGHVVADTYFLCVDNY